MRKNYFLLSSVSVFSCCELQSSAAGVLSPLGPGLSSMSREAPRPAQCVRAGWISDYVLNKPCDCRHVSQLQTQTPLRHMSLTCWTVLSTPHLPARSAPSLCCWSKPICVVLLHRGRVPCTTTLRISGVESCLQSRACLWRQKVEQQISPGQLGSVEPFSPC